MYIVLEGVDGAGKTAIAKRFAERTRGMYWKHLNDPAVHPAWLRDSVPGLNDAAEEFLIASFIREGHLASRQRPIIQDRGLLSAIVYRRMRCEKLLPQTAIDHYWSVCLPYDSMYVWVRRPLSECRLERYTLEELNEIEAAFRREYTACPLPELSIQTRGLPVKTILPNFRTVDDACALLSDAIQRNGGGYGFWQDAKGMSWS